MKKHSKLVEMLLEVILRHRPQRLMDYFSQEKGFDVEYHTDAHSLVQKTHYPDSLPNIEPTN